MLTPKILTGIDQSQEYYLANIELFERLAVEEQSPEALVIACSDSRIPPALLNGIEPGSLFVTRNVANLVPPFGTGQMSIGATVEFAVQGLHVGHIIIVGHTDCGGIRALDEPPDWSRASHLARWLEYARPAKIAVEASGLPPEEFHLATVRENVLLQLENLRSYDPVREGERSGSLLLHGWVYHLETGAVEGYDAQAGAWGPLELSEARQSSLEDSWSNGLGSGA